MVGLRVVVFLIYSLLYFQHWECITSAIWNFLLIRKEMVNSGKSEVQAEKHKCGERGIGRFLRVPGIERLW